MLGNNLHGSLRLQYFETNGYNSRIYAYERDLLYSASIPAFFDKGLRYYLTAKIDCSQFFKVLQYPGNSKIQAGLKWSQTIYSRESSIGSGLDEISGKKKSEFRLQILIFF